MCAEVSRFLRRPSEQRNTGQNTGRITARVRNRDAPVGSSAILRGCAWARESVLEVADDRMEHACTGASRVVPARRCSPMLRLEQPNNHDYAYKILKAISGQELGERDYAAWESWLNAVAR